MKHDSFNKLLLILLLQVISITASADFQIDGIYYNPISSNSGSAVEVIKAPIGAYSGNIIIPQTVTKNGTTYRVTSIKSGAFEESYITSVTIPNSITHIGSNAFDDCDKLTSLHIYSIEDWCKIVFENSKANPFNYAQKFYLNNEELSKIVIPYGVTEIKDFAFYGSSLSNITIPNSVTSIGLCAFEDCAELTSMVIPNTVTSIGICAFNGCYSLTSVTIPNSVISIGDDAFKYCRMLSDVYFQGSETEWNSISGHKYAENDGRTIHYNGLIPVSNITLNETSVTLKIGEKKNLIVTVLPANASDTSVKWTSSNTDVVDFDLSGGVLVGYDDNKDVGTIVAKTSGTATITCTANDGIGVKATCVITVNTSEPEVISGDVNGDGKVSVSDFTSTANWILGKSPANFNEKAADVNNDNKISVSDLTGIANLILYGTVTHNTTSAK